LISTFGFGFSIHHAQHTPEKTSSQAGADNACPKSDVVTSATGIKKSSAAGSHFAALLS